MDCAFDPLVLAAAAMFSGTNWWPELHQVPTSMAIFSCVEKLSVNACATAKGK